MNKTVVSSNDAPKAVGPYSQAIQTNGLLFLSGQIGLDTAGILANTLQEQTTQIFKNIDAVLSEAGIDKTHVIKTTIFITNMGDFSTVNALYEQWVPNPYPARSTIGVASLPKGALIEIECTATIA